MSIPQSAHLWAHFLQGTEDIEPQIMYYNLFLSRKSTTNIWNTQGFDKKMQKSCVCAIFVVILRRIWISEPISQIRLFSACRWLNNLIITQ